MDAFYAENCYDERIRFLLTGRMTLAYLARIDIVEGVASTRA